MYAIYCETTFLNGFVTGSTIKEGSQYVNVVDLKEAETWYGSNNIGKIKTYQSDKRANNAIKNYENASEDKFTVRELTADEIALINLHK